MMRDAVDALQRALKVYTRDRIYTSMPAIVRNVEQFGGAQSVDVQPLISRVYEDRSSLASPIIYEVPVMFPSAGGGLLSFPIAVGDTVLLLFSMRSMEEWLAGGGDEAIPADTRHHSLTDAIAIPGLYTKSSHLQPHITDVEIQFAESSIRMQPDGDLIADIAKDVIATILGVTTITSTGKVTIHSDGDIELKNGTYSLTLKVDGTVLHSSGAKITPAGDFVTAAGVSLDNHTHPVIVTGGSSSGTYESSVPTV